MAKNTPKRGPRTRGPRKSTTVKLGKGTVRFDNNSPTWDESAMETSSRRWKGAMQAAKYNRGRKALFGKNPIRNYKKLAKADLKTPEHVARMAKIHSATTLGTEGIASVAGNVAAGKVQDTQIALLTGGTGGGSKYVPGADNNPDEDKEDLENPYGNRSMR